jgi:preprotein translocase subunit SecG
MLLHTIVLVIHVLASLGLIGLVLIQHGKGADAGAAFGSGASGTVFGSRGAANFLTRSTAVLATVFMLASMTLAFLAGHHRDDFTLESDPVSAKSASGEVKPAADAPASSVVPSAPTATPAPASESVSASPQAATVAPVNEAVPSAVPAPAVEAPAPQAPAAPAPENNKAP